MNIKGERRQEKADETRWARDSTQARRASFSVRMGIFSGVSLRKSVGTDKARGCDVEVRPKFKEGGCYPQEGLCLCGKPGGCSCRGH